MTGRIRVLVSLTVLALAVSGAARSATPPALVCKLPRDSTGRFHRPHSTGSSTTCRSTRPSRSRAPGSKRARGGS